MCPTLWRNKCCIKQSNTSLLREVIHWNHTKGDICIVIYVKEFCGTNWVELDNNFWRFEDLWTRGITGVTHTNFYNVNNTNQMFSNAQLCSLLPNVKFWHHRNILFSDDQMICNCHVNLMQFILFCIYWVTYLCAIGYVLTSICSKIMSQLCFDYLVSFHQNLP